MGKINVKPRLEYVKGVVVKKVFFGKFYNIAVPEKKVFEQSILFTNAIGKENKL